MRDLAHPEVLRNSSMAAAVSALACYPRLHDWHARPYQLWFMEAVLFLGGIVLWAFVFGWHTKYSGAPLFTARPDRLAFIIATLTGIVGAITQRLWLDPILKPRMPEDFPTNLYQWFTIVLFSLAFADLFVVFAPFDWLLRLSRSKAWSSGLVIVFGLFVLWLKQRTLAQRLPPEFFASLLFSRAVGAALSVYFYLRGGVLLVWWCHLLIHSRHLWHLSA